MKMEVHERQYKQRKGLLREFHRKAKAALSPKERSYLYGSLKEYQAYRQVNNFVSLFARASIDIRIVTVGRSKDAL